MADPYAAFSSPVEQSGNDPYASFSSPVQQKQEKPGATGTERAGAYAAGFNSGVAHILGIPVDAVANIRDLGKALLGTGHNLVASGPEMPAGGKPGPYGSGKTFDVDENGNLIPTASYPQIPSALQVGDRGQDFGSGDYLANQFNKLPGQPAANPRPDDAVSRYLFAGGQGTSSALLAPATGAPVTPTAISGITGAESAQFAAEHGAPNELVQAAGFAGGVAPGVLRVTAAQGTRQLARGVEEGRQKVQENIKAFEDAGTTPSIGQATESRIARASESLLTRTPGGAGRMAAKGETQGQQLGSKIEELATKLAPRSSGEQAGRAITKGITGEGGFIEQFKAKSSANYDQLDRFVKKDAPFVLPKTVAALDELTTPIPGAEKTSKFFINSKISEIKTALNADLKTGNNAIPYEAVKKIRSIVGEQLADAPFNGDVPRSQWKKLYSALSDDLNENAKAVGPQAESALTRANQYHAAGMKRLDVISSVIDKNGGPEAVFRAATSGAKEGATTLRAVMQSLPDDAQRMLSAGVLRRLGRATAGRQDDLGEKFSTETFLTNWNSMSPQAKAALFDRYGKAFRQDMDQIAKVSSNLREGSAVFRNPSGTSQAVAQTSAAVGIMTALATGNPKTAAAITAGIGGANLAARVMTNPNAVKWLAKTTKAPQSALPALINQAANSGDPDLKELAEVLKQQGKNQQN